MSKLELKIDINELKMLHDGMKCYLELSGSEEARGLTIRLYGAIQDYNYESKSLLPDEETDGI
jgi:hypothetical protein